MAIDAANMNAYARSAGIQTFGQRNPERIGENFAVSGVSGVSSENPQGVYRVQPVGAIDASGKNPFGVASAVAVNHNGKEGVAGVALPHLYA